MTMSHSLLPEKNDMLFQNGNHDDEVIIPVISKTFIAYAFSYKLAADGIARQYLDAPESFYQNFQVFPLLFLYRQYIELSLKAIISETDKITGTDKIQDNFHHRLLDLWAVAQNVIVEIPVNIKESTLLAVEELIKEFNKNDPLSFSFRYPMNKDGEIVPIKLHQISIKNFHSTMSKLSNFFDEVFGHLYHIGHFY
ncbi:MAG: hypothetical protein ACI8PB_000033 [Desulforhopalus sp.]|jgi:hypothetical protein